MNIGTRICLSCDGRTDGVTDTIDKRTALLGKLDGSQGISGFTTLGNGDDHIILRYHRITVTEFRCIFHFHRDAAIAIGSEGRGLSPELLDICGGEVIIPMNPDSESLNAAVAASIIMWEMSR